MFSFFILHEASSTHGCHNPHSVGSLLTVVAHHSHFYARWNFIPPRVRAWHTQLCSAIITSGSEIYNVIFQHPVALYISDFRSFCAVYVQRRSLFFLRIHLLDATRFDLTGRLQVYWPTNTQQNSHHSKNIKRSHNQQTK
jgi:hypothetical protein